MSELLILAGTSNPFLARLVCQELDLVPSFLVVERFSDQEIFIRLQARMDGADVFILQSTAPPANDHLIELLLTISAVKQAGASRITACLPYFGYGRQDRGALPALIVNLFIASGLDRILLVDIHEPSFLAHLSIPVKHISALPLFAQDIQRHWPDQLPCIVAPDKGGFLRAQILARALGAPLFYLKKERTIDGTISFSSISGNRIQGRDCIIIDDIVDSGLTLCEGANVLADGGAANIFAYGTHGVLSGKALERLEKSHLKTVTITDTIPQSPNIHLWKKMKTLTIAPLISAAIGCFASTR